jgi:hypothetical protein
MTMRTPGNSPPASSVKRQVRNITARINLPPKFQISPLGIGAEMDGSRCHHHGAAILPPLRASAILSFSIRKVRDSCLWSNTREYDKSVRRHTGVERSSAILYHLVLNPLKQESTCKLILKIKHLKAYTNDLCLLCAWHAIILAPYGIATFILILAVTRDTYGLVSVFALFLLSKRDDN